MKHIIHISAVLKNKAVNALAAMVFALMINTSCSMGATETVLSGSFIVNMGVTPQTIANGLKPYGLVYDLIVNYQVPVIWSIEPTKTKDEKDFTYNAVDYKGGTFVISSYYINSAVTSRITYWQGLGVQGVYTTSSVTVPVYTTLRAFPKLMIDDLSGNSSIIISYFTNAGIPSSAYSIGTPADLTSCYDLWCNPHADPNWTTHNYLYNFVTITKGWIWGQCHAVSMLEAVSNPSSPFEQLNFLTASGMKCYSSGKCGSIIEIHASSATGPFTYSYPAEPVMQFMGTMDGACDAGSERWYRPLSTGGWNSLTKRGVTSATGTAPGEGALLVYGPAYNNPPNGWVMYEGGHNLNAAGTAADRVSAQRAYFNFALLAAINRQFQCTSNIPSGMSSGNTYNLAVTITGGAGPFTYQWSASMGGTFGSATSATTTYAPPSVSGDTTNIVKVIVTDACGRVSFDNIHVYNYAVSPLPVSLLEFTAVPQGTAVGLNWVTLSEKNNHHFTIERSPNGKQFSVLKNTTGSGNSTIARSYSFTDRQPLHGTSYYRLKQTDFNGNSVLLKSVTVKMEPLSADLKILSVFPNPFENDPVVEFSSDRDLDIDFELINSIGKILRSGSLGIKKGISKQKLADLNTLEQGVYYIIFHSETLPPGQIRILKR